MKGSGLISLNTSYASLCLGSSLFWDTGILRSVYRRFGTNYRPYRRGCAISQEPEEQRRSGIQGFFAAQCTFQHVCFRLAITHDTFVTLVFLCAKRVHERAVRKAATLRSPLTISVLPSANSRVGSVVSDTDNISRRTVSYKTTLLLCSPSY